MGNLRPIVILIASCYLIACAQKSVKKPGDQESSDVSKLSGNIEDHVFPLTSGSVVVSDLLVKQLSIAHTLNGKLRVGRLSFAVNPKVDFAQLEVCHTQTGDCYEKDNLAVRKELLPVFDQGTLRVKVRACVDAGRLEKADDEVQHDVDTPVNRIPEADTSDEDEQDEDQPECGAWSFKDYEQPDNIDVELRQKHERLANLRARLADYGRELRQILIDFDEESDECVRRKQAARKVVGLKVIAKNLIALGEPHLERAVQNLFKSTDDAAKSVPGDKNGDARAKTLTDAEKCAQDTECSLEDLDIESPEEKAAEEETSGEETPGEETPEEEAPDGTADENQEASLNLIQDNPLPSPLSHAAEGFTRTSETTGAIQNMTEAVIDIFTAKAQVGGNFEKYPCLAEKKARDLIGRLKRNIDSLRNDIDNLETELDIAEDEKEEQGDDL